MVYNLTIALDNQSTANQYMYGLSRLVESSSTQTFEKKDKTIIPSNISNLLQSYINHAIL